MADSGSRTHTHFSALTSSLRTATTAPAEPVSGDFYYDTANNKLCIYNATIAQWKCASFSTSTSTSSSTSTTSTTTSTSTTSTSSSTSTTTSTSTSTTTSTTTTF